MIPLFREWQLRMSHRTLNWAILGHYSTLHRIKRALFWRALLWKLVHGLNLWNAVRSGYVFRKHYLRSSTVGARIAHATELTTKLNHLRLLLLWVNVFTSIMSYRIGSFLSVELKFLCEIVEFCQKGLSCVRSAMRTWYVQHLAVRCLELPYLINFDKNKRLHENWESCSVRTEND